MMEARLLVLCAMLAYASAGTLRSAIDQGDTCATTCKPPAKFSYRPGQTYSYDYKIQAETSMDGASEERAGLSITGQADIEVIDTCEMVLKLRNVRIDESKPSRGSSLSPSPRSQELRRLLETSPLRFSFQDGVVAELCPDRQEDPWALNVKRGLLSALQNSMDTLQGEQSVQEADVTGRCQTKYAVTSSFWGKTSITRNKDLMACTDRHSYSGSLQSMKYQMASDLQALPLLTSDHECQQEVSGGIIQSSVCTEKHLFRPFSAQNSGGAVTTVAQRLTFRSQQSGITSRKGWVHSRAGMTFDHGYTIKDSSEARARAESLLSTLCDATMNSIQIEVPRVFSQLVGAVQKLDRDDIRDIYRQLQDRRICSMNNDRTKKFFMDALPMAGSSGTVDQMMEMMLAGDVTGMEVDMWLASLAFIPEPTADMIQSVTKLLQNDDLKVRSMLAVSTMVNNHCQKQGCSSSAVDDIMQSLEGVISYRCSVNDGNIKTVLTALSAIGNTGQPRAVTVLNRCLNYRVPIEVRVAAAQAFRRMPCGADKRQLLTILKDTNEDSEIRIAAYLQTMTCPTSDILTQIQIIMEGESEDSQVGSFVWSHLSNMMETSNPLKQDVKQMLKDIELKKMFDLNPLKFSRNYEKSAFLKMLNSGLQTESHVIWSTDSPLPRSVSANLTVDLFGHSINLLEIGGRLEGVDYLIETVQTTFFGDSKDRSSKRKLDELKGSGFARIFGNELVYNRFQGIQSLTSGKTFNLLDFLIKLSRDHDYSFTQSLQFLDSSLTVPTAIGLPLTLSVNGTAVVDVKASGKMDLRKVSKSPRSVHIDGEIRPSGAVNVDGVMSVDALVTRTGLKVTSSLHSSLAMKGRVELDRGRVLSVHVDMPDDRMDILDVRSKFFILHNEDESEQKMITENRKEFEMCSGDMVSKMIGLELCGQLQFPNASMHPSGPYFPLTGPSSVSVVLHKRDSHTGYKLLAKRVENKRSSIAQLSFDTPGSSVVRAVSFDMMINYPGKEAEISFASPWKKTSIKGSIVNEGGLKSLAGSVVIDDDQIYSLTSEVKVDEKPAERMRVLTPMVELRRPGAEAITLMGSIQMDTRGRSFNTDLTLSGVTKKELQVQASYTNTQTSKRVSGSLTQGKKTYSAEAGVNYNVRSGKSVSAQFNPTVVVTTPQGDMLRLEGTADYRQDKMLRSDVSLTAPFLMDKPVTFKCNIVKKGRGKGVKYNMDIRLKSKPFTGKLSGFVNVAETTSTKLTVDYNVYRVGRDRVTINGKLSNKSTAAFKKYTLSSTVDFRHHPDWSVQTSLDFDHKKKRTGGTLSVKLGKDPTNKNKQILLSTSVDRKIKDLRNMDIDYKIKAIVPMLDVDTSITGVHSHSPRSLASKMTMKYAKNKDVKAEINLKDKSDKQIRMNGDASLSFPGHSYELDSSLKKNGKQYTHTVNMKTHNGHLLTATSTYRASKGNTHDVTSDIQLDGYKPVKVSGMASLQWDNLDLQTQLTHGQDSYSLKSLSKVSRGPRGKWTVEMSHPSRNVAFIASGGLQKNSVEMDLDLAWDKDRDDSAKMTLKVSGTHKSNSATTSSNAKLDFTSPFQSMEKLSASVNYDNDKKRYGLDGKVTVGSKSNAYYSTLNVRKPLSPSNVQLTWSAGTPIRGLKRLEASVQHRADSNSLSTVMKASKGKSQMQITINGMDKSVGMSRDLSGDIAIQGDVAGLEDVSLTLVHKDDGRKYETSGALTHNNDRYSADLDMSHFRRGWQMQNNGQLRVTCPHHDIAASWQHRVSDNDLKSTLTSKWGRGKQLQVELTGSKQFTDMNNRVNGALIVRSPWNSLRDLSLTLNHDMSDSHCSHSAALVHNGQKKASTDLNYQIRRGDISGDFSLTNPFMENKSGSLTAKYGSYPVTGRVELQTAPRSIITGDISFSKSGDMDMEGTMRITTPIRAARTVTITGSIKQEGEDLLLKTNLDYGVRQNYDAEVRIRPDTLTLARVKIHTPLDDFSSLDAGYQISGDSADFDATADFAVQPVVGKYSGSLNWRLDSDLSAKLRINTPHRDLRYMQLIANSKGTAQGRKSRLEAEYYPRQVYALTSFYTTDMPIIFSLNAETPIQGYDSFGLSVKYEWDDSSINTHGEVQYLSDKVIEGTLGLNWDRNVAGSLVVKTPFRKFEENKLSVRHDGDLDDFTCHAEMEFMQETMSADAQFKYGYTTSGTFSLTSSLQALEKVDASFNKRGNSDNFKSSAWVSIGDKKIQGNLQHKITAHSLKTSASFNSPFTRNIKSSVDISSQQGNVQATVSGQYGPKKVESKSTVQISQPDFSASSSLTYQLDREPQEMTVAVSKKGEWDNVDLAASFASPFTEDAALSVQHTCNLPYNMNIAVSGNYGSRYSVKSDNGFDSRINAFSASSVTTYRLAGPARTASASVSKNGDWNDVAVAANAKYEDQEIKVEGELNTKNGVTTKLQASTPFSGFENMGMDLTYVPNDQGFRQHGSVTYMTDRKIQHSVIFSHNGHRTLQLDASVTSPISYLENNSLKVRYANDVYRRQCSGSAEVESALGKQVVSYKRSGDWDHLTLETSAEINGEMLEGTVMRVPLTNGYKNSIELKGWEQVLKASMEYEKTDDKIRGKANISLPPSSIAVEGEAFVAGFNSEMTGKATVTTATIHETSTFSLKKSGDWDDVVVEAELGLFGDKGSASAEFKNAAEEVSGKLMVSLPLDGYRNIGASFKHSGDLDRFNSQGSITYMDNKDISGKVGFYRYMWRRVEATAELRTPFSGFRSTKAEYRHAGSADSFTCFSSVEYDSSRKISADLRVTLSPKYDITLTVKTPFSRFHKIVADAKLESLANTHTASCSLDMGRGRRYAVDGSLDMDSIPMTVTGKLTTPFESLRSVEISGSHQGSIDDFSCSFVFNSPQTDVIKGDAMLKYNSVYDTNGAVSLSSELEGARDLRAELKTTDLGSSKTGHVMARWAPQQQVALDGTFIEKDYWYNKELEADITLTTPFQAVRSASVHMQHEQKDERYAPKVDLTLNGKTLLDVEGELITSNSASASITSTKPWPAQLSGSLTRNGDEEEMEVFVNWNRDKNDKNVRVQTKAKNIKDDYQRDMDYSIKVILPSRTLSSGMKLLKKEQQITSDGYLAWNDRANSKVFYSLELNDGSQYYRKMYDGTVKLGMPMRTLEGSGSFSSSRQTSAMDATFSWDAERDVSKQVGVSAKVTEGDKTKMDLSLRLPALGKEVHVDHEMTVNQGRTVWDGKTALSYSPDSRKTLTLASSLKDVSDVYSSGKNYTLAVAISHPHTETDISFISHIGATGDRYSAAMDTMYLTSRRQRTNIALRGEIDQLRRQIDLQLVSPIKTISVHGEVESTEPYVIKLTNTFDDGDVLETQLNVDPERRSLLFTTNYDLDNPDYQIVLKAGYVNASAFRAELYRQQEARKISDALLAVRLNSSTLLHTRLAWRPNTLTDMQTFVHEKSMTYTDAITHTMESATSAVGQEVSDKYAAITEELLSELSPVLDLVESELSSLGAQMERSRKRLARMYRTNDLYSKDIGDYMLKIIDWMKEYNEAYRTGYYQIIQAAREQLDQMKNFNIREQYDMLVGRIREDTVLSLARNADWMIRVIADLDDELMAWKVHAQDKWEEMKNHPSMEHLHRRVQLLGHDYKWLMGYMGDRVREFTVPEEYASAIYNARDIIADGLLNAMESRQVKKVKNVANEIYQQGAWAYKYWQVEENARKHALSAVELISELIKEELEKLTEKLAFLKQSKVTVYDPEQGEIQAEVVLPIHLKSLREMPDLQFYHTYLKQANDAIDQYVPDKSTVLHYYNQYAPWVRNETAAKKSDIMSQFEAYQPSTRRGSYRNRRVRGM